MSENEQLPEAKPTLEELVARITDENRHPETDWGEPVGEEVWRPPAAPNPALQRRRCATG